jgi:nitroreductase
VDQFPFLNPMTFISPETLTGALNWRYATKKFDSTKKIPAELWSALEDSLVLAPSSYGLQPWRFVVVTDKDTKARLSSASWGQTQPADCSHYVVFAGRKNYDLKDVERFMQRTAQVRGSSESMSQYSALIAGSIERARKGGYLDTWMAKQSYIALGQFMTSAAVLGVDTCPMEGIDPAKYDEILGLTQLGYGALVACAAGYRSPEDKYSSAPKVRFEPSEVVIHV